METTATPAETTKNHMMQEEDDSMYVNVTVVNAMMEACAVGNLELVEQIVNNNGDLYACQQIESTGASPLMAAAAGGHGAVCQFLLEQGAPWNAVDRNGQCAGNYATDREHWDVVNLLVEWGTRAELILGMVERGRRDQNGAILPVATTASASSNIPVEHEPSTKPDYLRQRLRYTADGQSLLDADGDAVMMEWERPLMRAHAEILMEPAQGKLLLSRNNANKRVLNVGFGMGIIDSALQLLQPAHHIIVEAHPDVYKRMIERGWNENDTVRICFGKWQDILPQLIAEGVVVDAIFYDTYGEHFLDLEDFHAMMVKILAKPGGIYSFFNGLAPDNLFFHGVACQCVKLQLAALGLDSEFLPCEIQVKDEVWEGVRRKYWHGRDTYYLPVCKWNPLFLQTGQAAVANAVVEEARQKRKAAEASDEAGMETDSDTAKRLQTTF